jgi:hypothetical protein
MSMMPLELIEQLPPEIDPQAVVDHVFVGHAPGGAYGETHLVSHGGQLHVFCRGSMLSKFEELPLNTHAPPRLERGSFNSTLHVVTPDGDARIVLSMFEVDSAAALVGAIHPDAVGPDPDAPDVFGASNAPPSPPAPPPHREHKKARTPAQPPPPPQPQPQPQPRKPKPPPTPQKSKSAGGATGDVARYEKQLARRPDDVVASLSLEEIYRKSGDYANLARILLTRVDHLDSILEQVETLREIADIYAVMDKTDNALQILQAAYLLDYTNHDTVSQLEHLVDEHNLWNKLLTGLNEEVQHHDEISARAGVLVQMSRWYRKIYSRPDYADACLMHAKRLDPQHPEVLAALKAPA